MQFWAVDLDTRQGAVDAVRLEQKPPPPPLIDAEIATERTRWEDFLRETDGDGDGDDPVQATSTRYLPYMGGALGW
eukprot:SAG11_NODE_12693_length_690_cov_1.174281_2_plen_76_part_00